jgi:hypothetical protein
MRNILPLVGVDDLRFGMRPQEVRASLGSVLHYEDWMGGNLEDFLFYKGVLIGFSGDNGDCPADTSELVIIELHGDQPLSLLGKSIGACTKKQLLHVLVSHAVPSRELSPTAVSVDQLGLTFAFTDQGVLSRVSVQRLSKPSDA